MNIINAVTTKKLLDELGTQVLNTTLAKFTQLKEITKKMLADIAGDVAILVDQKDLLSYRITDTVFTLRVLESVSLTKVEDGEFIDNTKILTDANIKKRYTGRIVFYFKRDNLPNLVLGELFINESGNFAYISMIGWKSEQFTFRPESMFENEVISMINKGVSDAFFQIENSWQLHSYFENEDQLFNQGTKIGFV